jgi:glycosyltransferase involved in cell wall biosynthesis
MDYSWYAARAALLSGKKPHILTRCDFESEGYHERFSALNIELHPLIEQPAGFWYGMLNEKQFDNCRQAIAALHVKYHYSLLFFPGFDEFQPALEANQIKRMELFPVKVKTVVVTYNANFVLKKSVVFKNPSRLDFLRRIFNRIRGRYQESPDVVKYRVFEYLGKQQQRLCCLIPDERISKKDNLSRRRTRHYSIHFLTDPSPDVPQLSRDPQSAVGPLNLLIVGLQNSRKGFHDLMRLLQSRDLDPMEFCFTFLGRLHDDTEKYRSFLSESPLIKFHEGFFPEEQLFSAYSEADYVLLPYTYEFHGSSGVLAHAAAFGKPVLATAHGLIGYRVATFKLGSTYPSGDIDALDNCIQSLPRRNSDQYRDWRRNQLAFARTNSIDSHIQHLIAVFS